jgi:hypothetical protein
MQTLSRSATLASKTHLCGAKCACARCARATRYATTRDDATRDRTRDEHDD